LGTLVKQILNKPAQFVFIKALGSWNISLTVIGNGVWRLFELEDKCGDEPAVAVAVDVVTNVKLLFSHWRIIDSALINCGNK